MSATIATAPADASAKSPVVRDPALLRLWLPISILAAYWAFMYVNQNFEFSSAGRFLSRIGRTIAPLPGLHDLVATRRAMSWRDRLLAIAVVLGNFNAGCARRR